MLTRQTAAVDALGIVPGGRVLVAAASRLAVFDAARRSRLAELSLSSRVVSFRVSSDGRRIVAIPPPPKTPLPLPIVDLDRYRLVAQLDELKAPVLSAYFVQGDRRILTAGADGAARLWDAETGALWKTYPRTGTYLVDAVPDPSGTMIVTAGGDGGLRFWDIDSARLLWMLPAFRGKPAGMHFEGNEIVIRGYTGELARWALPSRRNPSFGERVLRCMPFRFDEEAGAIAEQDPHCETQ